MKGYTHAAIGANAIWIAALTGHIDMYTPLLVGVGALSGLLPDIDAPEAKIHYLSKGFTRIFIKIFAHRTFFHSLLCIGILFLVCAITLTQVHPLLPFIITIGYATHPLIDGLTPGGVAYLYPNPTKYHLTRKKYRVSVGGLVDTLLFVAGCGGILLFFSLYLL